MPHPSILRCAEALTRLLPDFEAMRKAPPASDAVIDALETKLGQPLPADVADWLRVVNGSKDHYGFCLSAACDFLSADEIAMYWGFFADPLHSITQTFQHTDHPHRVRAPAAPGTRIPVAHHSALASTAGWLVIDVAPVHPQHRGQVLFCPRDPERSVFVVFERFTDLLDAVT